MGEWRAWERKSGLEGGARVINNGRVESVSRIVQRKEGRKEGRKV